MKLPLILLLLLLGFTRPVERVYKRTYHKNGKLASEGWLLSNEKYGYWIFYHDNGELSSKGNFDDDKRAGYWYFYRENALPLQEGHFDNNHKIAWWLFYDSKGRIDHKCQLSKDVKNGFCLKYKNEKLIFVEKYANGKKIKEWTSFSDFQKENSISDLK